MTPRIRTLSFLPDIFNTPTNAQFLQATLDQIVDQPNLQRIEGYIGSKLGYGVNAKDKYVTEPTKTRTDYQLDPGVVFLKNNTSTAQDFISYPGIIDALKVEGGFTADNSRLFNSEFYSWDSFTNLDKIINFNEYYWLPTGPQAVAVQNSAIYNAEDYTVENIVNGYNIYPGTGSHGSTNPTLTLIRGGTYTFSVSQSSQFWIQGEPGVTGFSQTQPNLQTRDVYGVSNNGTDTGVVIFTVPSKTAQDNYNFPGNNLVDVVSTLTYDQVNGVLVSALGDIDGISSLNGLTLMFYNSIAGEQGFISTFYDTTTFDQIDPALVDGFGNYEGGYYTDTRATFYTITYEGDPSDPVIRLIEAGSIPTEEKITATYGTQWGNRNFFRDIYNFIELIPYISAPLNTLYYQDGTSSIKVGIIRLIDSNATNTLNILTEILGKKTFTSNNGVVFTNGLKVIFQGDIYPTSYENNEYYVEGVGSAIELVPVNDLVIPEEFSVGEYIPYDSLPYDMQNYDSNLYVPVLQDYITISRNAINKNAWSRSNRWFHIDVINATAVYNNDPSLANVATHANKAKRPIIEFYPNLAMFDAGIYGKAPIDYFDTRTTDALSLVAGQKQYYPDVECYTAYTAIISAETPILETSLVIDQTYKIDSLGTTTQLQWNNIAGTTGVIYAVDTIFTCVNVGLGDGVAILLPTSTTITNVSGVMGTLVVGQFIADSKFILPDNSYITAFTSDTITVAWADPYDILAATDVSLITTGTTVSNYGLFDGARIVFAADTQTDVRNKIYVVNFSTVTDPGIPVITLTEAQDGAVITGDQTVAYRGYNNIGKTYHFTGLNWGLGQQKISVNQPPLFDIFDSNDISLSDQTVYLGSSFKGTKLFSYGIGSGLNDSILGFPIRYSSVNNVGDISFDINLNSDTFNFVSENSPKTEKINTGYVFNYTATDHVRQLGWQTAIAPSVQYQAFDFTYLASAPTTTFTCDITMTTAGENTWPTIQVYLNNVFQTDTSYSVSVSDSTTTVTFVNPEPLVDNVIQILLLSDQISPTAYYTLPINLNNNPLNSDVTIVNIGDIRGQYQSIFYNAPGLTGVVFGSNNYRDSGDLVPYGSTIIQNSASLVLPGTFLRKQDHNLFNALLFNSREYITFKTLLVDIVNNSEYSVFQSAASILDDAFDQITSTKSGSETFFWSDMLPTKVVYITNTYNFSNSLDVSMYPLSRIYDYTTANYYGVLVYLTRTVGGFTQTTQLIKDADYTISATSPSLTITLDLLPGDDIVIKEYNQTYGNYVPNTPTKLGLYPATTPKVLLDSSYNQPTYFIIGHDGSYNKLYGDYDEATGRLIDFRDQALLEFEKRIYNNLKLNNAIPIKEYEVLPGFFRNTGYSYSDILQIYSESFLNWVGQNRIDYKTQYYKTNDEYSYNYRNSGNKINNAPMEQGYWRGAYEYFYDTSTPDTAPWEMLGFTEQPSWWETRYGPAPYTSDNLVLWDDLAQGINWNDGAPVVITQAIRPQLLDVLPVDSSGNLVSPFISLVGNYYNQTFNHDWAVGDVGPAEFSYRRSSSWPFDLMRILALTKPAQFFNLAVDVDNYKYNEEFGQYLVNDRSHLVIRDVEIYGSGTAKTSYINWIVDYEKQFGIDATQVITNLLSNLDVRLVHRLAGFSDKNMLKFYVEKGTPNSNNSSLLIPDESYSVLLYDNQPFNRIVYSSVTIQIIPRGGYKIYGNSQTKAYFTITKPKINGNYQRVQIDNLSVHLAKDYDDTEVAVPYGTEYFSVQEVSQFLESYGRYLQSQGMVFDKIENGIEITWVQMVAEFLYWAQTGWESGSVLSINPAAKLLTINKDSNIVQPLTLQKHNFVLNQNLYPIQSIDLAVVRDGTLFSAEPLNLGDTIAYGAFNISNIEHGIVFDNITVFNDVIYNLTTGLRQDRVVVRGSKTADWTGIVDAQGFILNQDNVAEWSKDTKYTTGSIVTYKNKYWIAITIVQAKSTFDETEWKKTDYNEIQKGLLPNSSTRSYESTLYYNINTPNLENDADLLSFSLIGYRPRDYLAVADLTDITQVNVYRNMIKNKGTLNALSAFKGAILSQGGIDYNIYENWSIKSGEFGGVLNSNFVEFRLSEGDLTGNPSIVGLTRGVLTDGVHQEIPIYSLFNYGRVVTNPDVLPLLESNTPSILYPDAGYANFNDVKMSAYFYSGMASAVDSSGIIVPLSELYVRDYVWLANWLGTWEICTPDSLGQITNAANNRNGTTTITFKDIHNLTKYQSLAIVNFNSNVDGYYIATTILDPFRITINLNLNPTIPNITGNGVGFRFQSQRIDQPSDAINLPLLDSEFRKNTVWVDTNTDSEWAVYRKNINYSYEEEIIKDGAQTFGAAVAYSTPLGYLVSDSDRGEAYRYTFNALTKKYELKQTLPGISFTATGYVDGWRIFIDTSSIVGSPLTLGMALYDSSGIINGEVISWFWGYSGAYAVWYNDTTYFSYTGDTLNITGELVLPSFGEVIEHVDELIAIAQPKNVYVGSGEGSTTISPQVFLYDLITTIEQNELVNDQTLQIPTLWNSGDTTSFGDAIAISGDKNWIYVTGSYYWSYQGERLITVYHLSPLTNTYEFVNNIYEGDFGGSGSKFGQSLATNYYGDKLVVGSPNETVDSSTVCGRSYVFSRNSQNFEAQFTSAVGQRQVFPMSWQADAFPLLYINETSTTQIYIDTTNPPGYITGGQFNIGSPIIFTGTVFSNISPNVVYYIHDVFWPNSFSIALTRDAIDPMTLVPTTGLMQAYVQVETQFGDFAFPNNEIPSNISVSVNGTPVADNSYAVIDKTLVFVGGLQAGDIVNVSDYYMTLEQTLTSETTPREGVKFGYSVDTNKFASEILIGAPFEINSSNTEGGVFRYTSGGNKYGMIIGTSSCVVSSVTILLNGYAVSLPNGYATEAAAAINAAHITNIMASTAGIVTAGNFVIGEAYVIQSLGNTDFVILGASDNIEGTLFYATATGTGTGTAVENKLIIQLIDTSLAVPNNKLCITVPSDSYNNEWIMDSIGIKPYTQTQIIEVPHTSSRTQFGTVVKFNEFDSFVASAPAGTRFVATTFDFSDDENDNDTVFDNNTTQWIDTFDNAGAVYMFDYLGNYNESLSNIGNYVYAQSINDLNINYGAQPMYGQALDFNDNVVMVGTPLFRPGYINGQVIRYENITGIADWSVYRQSGPVVDIDRIQDIQLFSALTNTTLDNLDYLDPLQGKLLGAVRENIDVVSNIDPAGYTISVSRGGRVWGADKVGQLWFNTTNTRFVNYHQVDVTYNSKYWGTVFPGSDVSIYSWIASDVVPSRYTGPGVPYDTSSYTVEQILNPAGQLVPKYFFWVRNTNIIFTATGKTLSDTILENYISNPLKTGISFLAPIQPNVFALYNASENINANDTVLHIGYLTGTNDDVAHTQVNLIRTNYADDFLPGVPNGTSIDVPESLYNKMLDSMCGVDSAGSVIPDPYLPLMVQTGILSRPRQSFFYNRFGALKNYLTYANEVLSLYPVAESRPAFFLSTTGIINPSSIGNPKWLGSSQLFYDTQAYWNYINWWEVGYDDNTKAALQVPMYADLATLNAAVGLIVSVQSNGAGKSETYVYTSAGTWKRIGLQDGTIEFNAALWDYETYQLG